MSRTKQTKKQPKVIVGIDPDRTGAIAVLTDDDLDIWDLSFGFDETGGFNSLDPIRFSTLLDYAVPYKPEQVIVYCEESQVRFDNSIKTARPTYDSRGVLRTVFTLRGFEVNFVSPVTWKNYYGLIQKKSEKKLSATEKKALSVEKAIKLLPKHKDLFQREHNGKPVLLDGRAEAALIAIYSKNLLNTK